MMARLGRRAGPPTSIPTPVRFRLLASTVAAALVATPALAAAQFQVDEGFDNVAALPGWAQINNSVPVGGTAWFQGNSAVFPAFDGAAGSYIGANYNNTGTVGTISNWLISPLLNLQNGVTVSFWTRKPAVADADDFPDRLELRLSTAGASTNVGATATSVGDFATLLLSVNPTLAVGGYPESWTLFSATLSGLAAPTTGRIALRYYVTSAGVLGDNSDYIGIDRVRVTAAAVVPEPASVVLVAVGVGVLALGARRRATA